MWNAGAGPVKSAEREASKSDLRVAGSLREVGGAREVLRHALARRVQGTQVGTAGHVVATDINTRDLEARDATNVEVRQHDIVHDPLEESAFDLVHARLLLEHLRERDAVLRKLVKSLRPGGWLVIEDVDYVSGIPISQLGASEHEHTQSVRLSAFAAAGVDHNLGRRLPARLRQAGLRDVGNQGRVWIMEGGSPGAQWFALSLAHLRPRLVGPGMLTDAEVDRMLELFQNPEWSAFSPIIVAAWGRAAA
jgi:SAM-dependent methyltransferase